MDDKGIKSILLFQVCKDLTNFCKKQLILLEDLQNDHNHMVKKLDQFVEPEILNAINYFDDNKFKHERKRILDNLNETLRSLDKTIENFDINLKK